MSNHQQFVSFAKYLADLSGEVIGRYYRQLHQISYKEDDSPVTIADREAEQVISDEIKKHYPDHMIIGEEFGEYGPQSDYAWIIDPIDGTSSFLVGRPIFGTLIALTFRQEPVIGIIDQPITKERWVGAKGKNTVLNKVTCKPKQTGMLNKAVLSTTSPDLFSEMGQAFFSRVKSCVAHTLYGGDCYHYGLLASGHIDLIIEEGLNWYDIAAIIPVIQGANAVITTWDNRPVTAGISTNIVAAANPYIHEQAIALLNSMKH